MLKLVKDGQIESSPDILETLRAAEKEAEEGVLFSVAVFKLYNDEEREPELVISGADALITCSTAEEVARMCKLQLLGLM